MLNHKVKLIPVVNELINTVDYRKERFFDMGELIGILDTIDSLSNKTEQNFDEIYDMVYLVSCKRKIKERQGKIREAALYLKNYLIALNATKTNGDKVTKFWFEKFRRTCNGNKCYDSMRYLMGHIL